MKRHLAVIDYSKMTPPTPEKIQEEFNHKMLTIAIGIIPYVDSGRGQERYEEHLNNLTKGKLTYYKNYYHYLMEQDKAHAMILSNQEIPQDLFNRLVQATKEIEAIKASQQITV